MVAALSSTFQVERLVPFSSGWSSCLPPVPLHSTPSPGVMEITPVTQADFSHIGMCWGSNIQRTDVLKYKQTHCNAWRHAACSLA